MARPGLTEGEGPQAGHRPFSDGHADRPSRAAGLRGDAQGEVARPKGGSERLGARREGRRRPRAPHEEAGPAEHVNAQAYLPEALQGLRFYRPTDQGREGELGRRLEKLREIKARGLQEGSEGESPDDGDKGL